MALFDSIGRSAQEALDAVTPYARRIGAEGLNTGTIFNLGRAVQPQRSVIDNGNSIENTDSSYIVTLHVDGVQASTFGATRFKIRAFMPQNYSLQFGSSWATPLDKSFGEALQSVTGTGAGGKIAGAIAKRVTPALNLGTQIFGTANRHKMQTAHIWQQGQPLSLSIPFQFAAKNNTYEDVLSHFQTLSMLASPYEDNGILYPPGPTLAGAAIEQAKKIIGQVPDADDYSGFDLSGLSGARIAVQLGEFAYIEPIIIESVDSNIDTINDVDGKPMFMNINVNIKTYYTISANDISKMLSHPMLKAPASGMRSRQLSRSQADQPMLYDQDSGRYTAGGDTMGPYGNGAYSG